MKDLISKYDIPVPRYTSYPTVPNWNQEPFTKEEYLTRMKSGFAKANKEGLSIYIHLPYCESLCTYCGCNTRITINHAVEEPYVQAVLKEWGMLSTYFSEKPNIREIHLGGGTPTFFSPQNLSDLVRGILMHANVLPDASFSFEAHPGNTSNEHLLVLRKLGFDRLSLGIQDFDSKVQKAINRKQTVQDVERVVVEARALGYRSINFDLIYGLPFQTLKGVEDAARKVVDLNPDRIAFYSYAHVPWMKPGQRAYNEKDLPDAEAKLELFKLGRSILEKGGFKAIGFDHFAKPIDTLATSYENGKLHRNFMGFSDLKTPYLIGLGVSSISDISNGFAQNVKSVEGYMEKINEHELPIFKGHLHTTQDSFIRKHILNLTCKHFTSWQDTSREERIYMRQNVSKLKVLQEDGLVQIGLDKIKVTEKGRLFVRHICSAFDKDYVGILSKEMYSKGV